MTNSNLYKISKAITNIIKKLKQFIELCLTKKQIRKCNRLKDPIFLIAIHGSLHLVDICLTFIPATENIVLILNGLDGWEVKWVRNNLKELNLIKIIKNLDHPYVLNLLFHCLCIPFGILDYDCYILESRIFSDFKTIQENSLGNALFIEVVQELRLPETHAMFFNTKNVKDLMQRFGVDCSRAEYPSLPLKIQEKLSLINITEKFLDRDLNKFDTLRLLILLGISKGMEFNYLGDFDTSTQRYLRIFHVGCVYYPEIIHNKWRRRGSYFWQRALSQHKDNGLQQYYGNIFRDLPKIHMIKTLLHKDGYNEYNFFGNIETMLMHYFENISQ